MYVANKKHIINYKNSLCKKCANSWGGGKYM